MDPGRFGHGTRPVPHKPNPEGSATHVEPHKPGDKPPANANANGAEHAYLEVLGMPFPELRRVIKEMQSGRALNSHSGPNDNGSDANATGQGAVGQAEGRGSNSAVIGNSEGAVQQSQSGNVKSETPLGEHVRSGAAPSDDLKQSKVNRDRMNPGASFSPDRADQSSSQSLQNLEPWDTREALQDTRFVRNGNSVERKQEKPVGTAGQTNTLSTPWDIIDGNSSGALTGPSATPDGFSVSTERNLKTVAAIGETSVTQSTGTGASLRSAIRGATVGQTNIQGGDASSGQAKQAAPSPASWNMVENAPPVAAPAPTLVAQGGGDGTSLRSSVQGVPLAATAIQGGDASSGQAKQAAPSSASWNMVENAPPVAAPAPTLAAQGGGDGTSLRSSVQGVPLAATAIQGGDAGAGQVKQAAPSPASWNMVENAPPVAAPAPSGTLVAQGGGDGTSLRSSVQGVPLAATAIQGGDAGAGQAKQAAPSPASWNMVENAPPVAAPAPTLVAQGGGDGTSLRSSVQGVPLAATAIQGGDAGAGQAKQAAPSPASWNMVENAPPVAAPAPTLVAQGGGDGTSLRSSVQGVPLAATAIQGGDAGAGQVKQAAPSPASWNMVENAPPVAAPAPTLVAQGGGDGTSLRSSVQGVPLAATAIQGGDASSGQAKQAAPSPASWNMVENAPPVAVPAPTLVAQGGGDGTSLRSSVQGVPLAATAIQGGDAGAGQGTQVAMANQAWAKAESALPLTPPSGDQIVQAGAGAGTRSSTTDMTGGKASVTGTDGSVGQVNQLAQTQPGASSGQTESARLFASGQPTSQQPDASGLLARSTNSSTGSLDQTTGNPNSLPTTLAGRGTGGQQDASVIAPPTGSGLQQPGLQQLTQVGTPQGADTSLARSLNQGVSGNDRVGTITSAEPKVVSSSVAATDSAPVTAPRVVGPGAVANSDMADASRVGINPSPMPSFGAPNAAFARSAVDAGPAGQVTGLPAAGGKIEPGAQVASLAGAGKATDIFGQMLGPNVAGKGLTEGLLGPAGKLPGEAGLMTGIKGVPDTGIASTTKGVLEPIGKLGEAVPGIPGALIVDKGGKPVAEPIGGKAGEIDKTGKIETSLTGVNKTLLPGMEEDGVKVTGKKQGVNEGDPEVRLQALLDSIKRGKGKGEIDEDGEPIAEGSGKTDPFGNSLNTQGQILGTGTSGKDPDPTKSGNADPNAATAGSAQAWDPKKILPDLEIYDPAETGTHGVPLPITGVGSVQEPVARYDINTVSGLGQGDVGGVPVLPGSMQDPGVPQGILDSMAAGTPGVPLPGGRGDTDGTPALPGSEIDRIEVAVPVSLSELEARTEKVPELTRREDTDNGVVSAEEDVRPQEPKVKVKDENKKDEGIVGRIESLMETMLTDMATGRSVDDPEARALIDKLFDVNETEREEYVVYQGDTLESIARRKLKDRRYAPLLYTINRNRLSSIIDLKNTELKAGTVLYLPGMAETLRYKVHVLGDATPLHVYVNTRRGSSSSDQPVKFDRAITYTCRLGDTLASIAQRHPALQDASLWKLIAKVNMLSTACDANGQPRGKLKRGKVLHLPKPDQIDEYRKAQLAQSMDETLPQLKRSVLANRTFSADPSGRGTPCVPNPSSAINMAPVEKRVLESRIITQTDLGEGNSSLLLRLEVKTSEQWKPVVEYVVTEQASGLKFYDFQGQSKHIRINLPTRAARELAENDLAVNAEQYCAKFLACAIAA